MNNFSNWLGEESGKEMIIQIANQDASKEQIRCAITTYCMLYDIDVDSKRWDELIRWFYDCYDNHFNNRDELDMYMCKYLV